MAAINLPIVSKFDDKGIKKAESGLAEFGKVAAGIAAAATVAVTAIAVKSGKAFMDFDEQLNKSLSIMGNVSDVMREDMSNAAREVAKQTTFSAGQAAESFFFLASAGLDAEQSIAAMPQVAAFAQAGMFDMARATDLATDAQTALGLSSDDAAENLENLTRVTDVFVATGNLANTTVEQLATAFTVKAGNALKTVKKDVEEGAAALALFADQGTKGEAAGTLLTNTIFGLSDRAAKAPEAFSRLGISVFDADEKMRNFADIADDLGNALGDLSVEQKLAELTNLGFSKQARNGVLMLTGQGDKIREYEEALRDAGGTTQEVARKQLETASAQFGILGSVINDVMIEIGSAFIPSLGNMAMAFAPLIDDLLPSITEFLDNRIRPAFERAAELFTDFSVSVQEGSFSMKHAMEDMMVAIGAALTGDGLGKMLGSFAEMRNTIINGFIAVIPGVVNAVVEILPAVVKTLLDMIPELLESAVETFNALVEAVVIILPILLKALLDMLPDLIKTIISLLPKIIDSAIVLFTGLITALIEVIPELIDAIIDSIPEIMDAIISALPQIIEAAFKLYIGLVTALHKAFPEVISALFELFPKIFDALDSFLPQLLTAGFEIVAGLAKGMMDAIPRLIGSAARAIGSALTNGVNAIFQIRSPSRVFMDIGEDVVSGLSKGITDNLRQLEGASVAMTSTVTATAQGGFGDMSAPTFAATPASAGHGGSTFNINVTAGIGTDPVSLGREVVNAIKRYEAVSGKVFAKA